VIQRLFATGMALQGAGHLVADQRASQQIDSAIDQLDLTIRTIRTVIFDTGSERPASVRRAVLDLAREAARTLGFDRRWCSAVPSKP
jgi:signal transduction histidine kinase